MKFKMNESFAKYLPLGLFSLVTGKLLIFGITWEGAALALVAAALYGITEYKNQSNKIKELESKIELVITTANNQAKAIDELRTGLASVRIGQQAKSLQPVQPNSTQRIF